MTKKEAAIISVHTGYLIGSLQDAHAYAEEIIGRRIDNEHPACRQELYEKSKNDFINITID